MLPTRDLCRRLVLLAPLLTALGAQASEGFPSAPIRLIVPFPPGGGADATARLIAQKLATRLGQTVLVDNRAGANGSIGTGLAAKAPADGHTLLFTDRGALGINPSLYKKLPYDPVKDFAYVGIAARSPLVLLQNSSRPARSLRELVAEARRTPCKINYASFGIGSMAQLGMESLNAHYGLCTTHVPYKGGGPALMAAVGGEVDLTLAAIGPAMPAIRDGRLVPLAVSGSERSGLMPQVPSVAELQAPADLLPGTWFGFAYPQRTPRALVERMSGEIRAVLAMPEVKSRLLDDGFETGSVEPAKMAEEVNADLGRFARLAARIGIQPE